MDQTNEVREVTAALTAKSTTATLDELREKGRKKVKLIRAADIASMIEETVFRVLQDTEQAEEQEAPELSQLVERSKGEFRKVLAQRQAEAQQAEANLERLSTLSSELASVTEQMSQLQARNAALEAAVAQGQAPAAGLPPQPQAQPAAMPPAFQQGAAPAAGAAPGASPAAQMEGANAEMMMAMMQQLNELKQSMAQGGAAQAAPAAAGGATDLGAALDKINNSLNERLEKFGRKMGISSAAEAAEVDYSSLFGEENDAGLESNMENVQVKKKKGGGIAGNLERLKKLKGGG